MSDPSQLKPHLNKIREHVLRIAHDLRGIVISTKNQALREYANKKNEDVRGQIEGMKVAAGLAGVELGDNPPVDSNYGKQHLKELRSLGNEVAIADELSKYRTAVQDHLDQNSISSMPEAIQAHIDQIIETLAEPLPKEVSETARELDAKYERAHPPPPHAADVLGWIQSESKNTQYSTGRMQARWAKDFMDGNYGKRAQALAAAKSEGKFIGYNNEGGASYIRIDRSMTHLCWNWDRVGTELPDTTGRLTAENLYNAYDSALNEYLGFIEKITRGLRQKGVASVEGLGQLFTTHLENHKGYTKTAGDKIITATKSLDKEKTAKLVEWAEKTQSKLDNAIEAAKGQ